MESALSPRIDGASALHIGASPRIAVEHMGDGPLVIFLHGIGGDRSTWVHQLTAFAGAGYCAAAWDTRGYGDSDDYDGADYHLIYDVGHLGNLENPVEFNRLLDQFLARYRDRANIAADPRILAG